MYDVDADDDEVKFYPNWIYNIPQHEYSTYVWSYYLSNVQQVDVKNKIPDILKSLEKKQYRLDILLTEENVKQGSNVYNATKISKPLEITDNHDPNPNVHVVNEQTEITNVSKLPP